MDGRSKEWRLGLGSVSSDYDRHAIARRGRDAMTSYSMGLIIGARGFTSLVILFSERTPEMVF